MIKLEIAKIKWLIDAKRNMLNSDVLSFEKEYDNIEDIKVKIRYTTEFEIYQGEKKENPVMEWINCDEGKWAYCLVQRSDEKQIVATLKAVKDWSVVEIDFVENDSFAFDTVNLLLLEIAFRNRIIYFDGLVLHASALMYQNEGIAFSAPSGTGKTTHSRLWRESNKVMPINDDHPAVKIENENILIYGTPWAGEERLFNKISCSLKGAVVLSQSSVNKMDKMDMAGVLKEFLPRWFLPYYNKELMQQAIGIYRKITDRISIYKLECRPDMEAVNIVKNMIFEKNEKE